MYTAINRGRHKLYIEINGKAINSSPFTVIVYPDPCKLRDLLSVVAGLGGPYGIAYSKQEEMVVSESLYDRLTIIDTERQIFRTLGLRGDNPDRIKCPVGIATDFDDNIYVSSCHKLQKFTRGGELMKCIGQKGRKTGRFCDPRGVTWHKDKVYVCDRSNHRIQVFDMDLNFIRSIGSHGRGRGEFDKPFDVKFDAKGKMYVAEYGNGRVQVMDTSGKFLRTFGERGHGKMSHQPSGLLIADKFVYVSDYTNDCILVYETRGNFVTSFGTFGLKEGEFHAPFCITACADGLIHVCDYWNSRVQIY